MVKLMPEEGNVLGRQFEERPAEVATPGIRTREGLHLRHQRRELDAAGVRDNSGDTKEATRAEPLAGDLKVLVERADGARHGCVSDDAPSVTGWVMPRATSRVDIQVVSDC
ncbi:hypothetical protein [Micromonospora sp. CPCC 205561]|uniref:hypothetical protein n=1 Tax=Micromonospora sp. CPCC 205561 TaxID=3122407 RepID=UPI002FF0507A